MQKVVSISITNLGTHKLLYCIGGIQTKQQKSMFLRETETKQSQQHL
jgi:hypothetical protein